MGEEKSEGIAGLEMLLVRRLLLQGVDEAWDSWLVRYVLGVGQAEAEIIIGTLEQEGYIEPVHATGGERLWECSVKGQALAQVTRIKPMPRAGAERKLQELLARIKTVNEDPYYLYRVKRAQVYGSFLTKAKQLDEINIAVALMPKEEDTRAQSALERSRITDAKAKGRVFAGPVKEFEWPQEEVIRFLQSRSRIVKVSFEERAIIQGGKKILFKE